MRWNEITDLVNSAALFVIPIIFFIGVLLNRGEAPALQPVTQERRGSWFPVVMTAIVVGSVWYAFRGLL